MLKMTQYVFKNTEINPVLLTTPFSIQTNWHVITGAPSCGKTTLINQLSNQGFHTVPEIAREYIEREMANGQKIHPIYEDAAVLQRNIKDLQLSVERELPAKDTLFLDGSVPSSLAWYRVFGLNPNEFLLDCFHHRYASVFILDPLPFHVDDQRVEELDEITDFLDKWQTRDFNALGYNVVKVPVLPPEERVAFVLERLS